MKTSARIFCVCILVCIVVSTSAQKNEIDAIKSLIERETLAFNEIDYKTWASTWSQTPYAFWSFADTTDVNSFSGWQTINAAFTEYFQTAKPAKVTIDRKWLEVKVWGNAAYARYTQIVHDNTARPPQAQVRVLEKVKGEWKIVVVTVIAIEKDNEPKL